MYLELIFIFFIIRTLRKSLHTGTLPPQWNKTLVSGMALTVGLLVIESAIPGSRVLTAWLAHAILLYIVYLTLYIKEFQAGKTLVYAVLPYLVVEVLSDLFKLIAPGFYEDWATYFKTAEVFAVLWMVAMWIITKSQRTALQKEQLKTQETEKQNRVTESLKAALEVQVAERTAALTLQKEELQHALDELKSTQAQLIQSEKMASLGELTAGIAHEIQNPLNFVNNFSEVNTELLEEMEQEIIKGNYGEVQAIAKDIASNEQKINHHGRRADAIVKGMLQHSRNNSSAKEPTDINALADEYLRLAYHGLRAKDKSFNATMKTNFNQDIGNIQIVPQEIGRVILNLITNAFYAVTEKKKQMGDGYEPVVTVSTAVLPPSLGGGIMISVKDNGNGIPQKVLDKIFQPFFTTKPTGEGTGLGLSMSYDIVTKGHGGELKVQTKEGEGAEFIINLPV